jgi:hypothetical protein
MAEIPTAEEFLISKNMPGFAKHTVVTQWMADFAKMHVEAALKEASEKGEIGDGDFISDGHYEKFIDKESILNSYPLTNIK